MAVIARRYATALFEAAREKNALDEVASAVDVLDQALRDESVRAFLLDPRQPRERKSEALMRGMENAPDIVKNFLRVVCERRREAVLTEVGSEFARLVLQSRGEARGVLEVAAPPSPDELERLRQKAQELFQVRVDFEVVHVPDLIGGFRLTVNNRRLDASVRNRLQRMKENLLSVSVG